jgi:hypothetical protein
MSNSASNPTPLSFSEFEDLIKNIERFYALGSRLSQAIEKQPCEYLIQEASMAFTKALMSLVGFLRFIPSSELHAKEGEQIIDLSSASVMARQVLEDTLTFLYLSEPNLTPDQKHFRQLVWQFHGITESIESAEFAESSNPDLPATRATREKAQELLRNNPLLAAIEGSLRGRVRDGFKNRVIYDNKILERRGIMTRRYDLPHKVLSNFAHFSAFSHHLILDTSGDWQKSWREFFLPSLSVAAFIAEGLEALVETFPETAQLFSNRERQLVANYRGWLRDKDATPK